MKKIISIPNQHQTFRSCRVQNALSVVMTVLAHYINDPQMIRKTYNELNVDQKWDLGALIIKSAEQEGWSLVVDIIQAEIENESGPRGDGCLIKDKPFEKNLDTGRMMVFSRRGAEPLDKETIRAAFAIQDLFNASLEDLGS